MSHYTSFTIIWAMVLASICFVIFLIYDNSCKYDEKIKVIHRHYYNFKLPNGRSIDLTFDEKLEEK